MSYVWITPRAALKELGQAKLSALTNEAGQQELIGTGDGATQAFTTPFVFGQDLSVFLGGVLQPTGYTTSTDSTKGERVVVTFTVAPASGIAVTASSQDATNADNLDDAILRAQRKVRGMIDPVLYDVPEDNSAIPTELLDWCAAIAWYLLAASPRRPGLLEAYPNIVQRYDDVYGGVDSDLKRVAKGTFSLRGILNYRSVQNPPLTQQVGFTSRSQVYTDTSRGVF